jgi:hypothetical protein
MSLDAILFGLEWDRMCEFFGVQEKRRDRMSKEYLKAARYLNESALKNAVESALNGRHMPTLGEWRDICRDAGRMIRDAEIKAGDNRHVLQAQADDQRSRGCRGGDCRPCPVRYCHAIGEHCRVLSEDIKSLPAEGTVRIVTGEMRRLSRIFQGIGFERDPADHCARHPVRADESGRLDLAGYYARYGYGLKKLEGAE